MRPDDPIAIAYLERSMVARIATRSPKGWPALTPLWFVWSGGRLYTTTGRDTLAARNAARDPNVDVLLDAEAAGRAAHLLRLRGCATVRPGLPGWAILARIALKYYGGGWRSELAHARLWDLRRRYYAQAHGVTIEIVPDDAELLARPD
ncbi:MAG TPA: pyridoxamine 5'-phosphate oxidase family protein [Myxococcota bacterium]|nr:pyridoxamine 5'-phosphate oxidase family protein [Myxococcota bacterium]